MIIFIYVKSICTRIKLCKMEIESCKIGIKFCKNEIRQWKTNFKFRKFHLYVVKLILIDVIFHFTSAKMISMYIKFRYLKYKVSQKCKAEFHFHIVDLRFYPIRYKTEIYFYTSFKLWLNRYIYTYYIHKHIGYIVYSYYYLFTILFTYIGYSFPIHLCKYDIVHWNINRIN